MAPAQAQSWLDQIQSRTGVARSSMFQLAVDMQEAMVLQLLHLLVNAWR